MENLSFTDEIEKMAAAKGLSIAEVCRRAGISQVTFSRWKNGNIASPLVSTVRKMQKVIQEA